MIRLGGNVITTENAKEYSSAAKGESIEDTIRTVNSYSDAIVLRHFDKGTSIIASKVSNSPLINAGDGTGQHPTQALLDLYTIYRECGTMNGLKISMVGDLAHGRTVRSLSYLLGKLNGNEITYVSTPSLKIGDDIKDYLDRHKVPFSEEKDFEKILGNSDVIYMTRTQFERIANKDEAKDAEGKYVINESNLGLIKKDSRILHPLPHREELDLPFEIEKTDKRVAYFRQVDNGPPSRGALLEYLLL